MGNCCVSLLGAGFADRPAYTPVVENQWLQGKAGYDYVPSTVQPTNGSRPQYISSSEPLNAHNYRKNYQKAQLQLETKYEMRDVVGVGSTSTVHRCIERSTGREFACKVIDKRHINLKFPGLLEQFEMEIAVLKELNHPNIIHLEDVFYTDAKVYMIMELMQGGELFDYVVEKGTLSEEEASDLVRRLASAIAYMHSMEIIHRDLKPENLLLTHKGPDSEVKIIDFGLSKVLSGNLAKSFLGTKGYLAPEMLQRQTYSKTIDVWALGVIVFVLLCGCLPFDDDHSKVTSESVQQKFKLRFPPWAGNLSPGAKDLLEHLLDINPKTRYTAEQALNHPWVNGNVKANNYLQSPKGIRKIIERHSGNRLSSSQGSNNGGSRSSAQQLQMPVPVMGGAHGTAMRAPAVGPRNYGAINMPSSSIHIHQQQQGHERRGTDNGYDGDSSMDSPYNSKKSVRKMTR